ncbi:response regulator [Psychrobium sp. 1_MG-2023]|uniref:response regulator n=1 Tax=Psychrobium sp. 1_MG-2023 TaxID=3062624 RepID=UPI000C3429D5|nr:response regulator [Psychrobium sp. 1_MG-2023]MDP2560909.1 response regulator [Psychrobium sp. 1_MG-2023]PKF55983.1 hypothetical protein CW748_11220 [Alteromonadales bacterium alter-6D02]
MGSWRFPLSFKFLGIAIFNLCLMIGVGSYALNQINLISIEVSEISDIDMPLIRLLKQIEKSQLEQTLIFNQSLRYAQEMEGHSQTTPQFYESSKAFMNLAKEVNKELVEQVSILSSLLQQVSQGEEKHELTLSLRTIESIGQDLRLYTDHVGRFFDGISQAQWNELTYQQQLEKIRTEQQLIKNKVRELIAAVEGFTQQSIIAVTHHEQQALRNIGLFIFTSLVLGLAISYVMTRMLTGPILALRDLTSKISKGDLSTRAALMTRDEVGDLSVSINTMISTLNTIANQADEIAAGNYEIEIDKQNDQDRLGNALFQMKKHMVARVEQIERSNKNTQAIMETAIDAIISVDEHGRILTVNSATERLFFYPPELLINQHINALIAQGGESGEQDLIAQYMGSPHSQLNSFSHEWVGLRKDGTTFPMMVSIGEVNNGNEIILTAFIRDLTQEKQFEVDLQSLNDNLVAQNEFKNAVSSVTDITQGETDLERLCDNIIAKLAEMSQSGHGTFYIRPERTEDNLILFGSYAFKARKNIASQIIIGEGLVGQCAKEKKSILLAQVPDDYIQINSSLGELTPLNLLLEPILFEGCLIGVIELASFEHYSDNNLKIIGQVSQSLGVIINNLQNQRRNKKLLSDSQALTEQLQQQQQELSEANQNLTEQTQRLKVSEEELKQQSEELRVSNEELAEQKEFLTKQKQAIEASKQDLASKAEQLSQASKYKSEFLANMSHELRTPLNSLLLLAKGLVDNKNNNLDSVEVEDAKVIFEGGNHLLTLINDILDLSKVEAGKLTIHRESVAISAFGRSLHKMFDPIAQSRSLNFTINVASSVPDNIITDGQRLEQVIRNLLSNAMKFTEYGDVILDIDFAKPQDALGRLEQESQPVIALRVIDSGIGIEANKLADIFEAFQQQDGSTSRKYGGTGLGLTIVKELTELLGGEVDVVSQINQGSTFSIYLPLVIPSDAKEGEEHRSYYQDEYSARNHGQQSTKDLLETPPPQMFTNEDSVGARQPFLIFIPDDRDDLTSDSKTLLIIDDDKHFAKVLRDYAREHGYKSLVAGDGRTGIYLAQAYQPNGIILDISLPDIDGYQVLEQLKANPSTKHIPVEIMSAHEENASQMLRLGAIGLETKPVSSEQLNQVLSNISQLDADKLKHVLSVEDDKNNQSAIKRLLESSAIDVTTVGTGQQGCEEVATGNYDCVILDIGLPDMSGFDVLKTINQQQHGHIPPVIIYTARDINDQEQAELNKYSSTVVIKGVGSPERLLDDVSLFLHDLEKSKADTHQQQVRMVHDDDLMLKGRKILLVDDDMRNIYALSKQLIELGLDVEMANHGQEALDLLKRIDDVELILMDTMMPVMDGYEATEKIRQLPQYVTTPIIALTAKTMPEDRERSLNAGASEYLTKPIELTKLLSIMRVWLFKTIKENHAE